MDFFEIITAIETAREKEVIVRWNTPMNSGRPVRITGGTITLGLSSDPEKLISDLNRETTNRFPKSHSFKVSGIPEGKLLMRQLCEHYKQPFVDGEPDVSNTDNVFLVVHETLQIQ